MTKAELIAALSEYPDDMEVRIDISYVDSVTEDDCVDSAVIESVEEGAPIKDYEYINLVYRL